MTAPDTVPATGPRRFRPTFWATAATIVAVLIMLGLGTWQVQRLMWKNDLMARIETRMAAAPEALPAHVEDPQEWDYRRVSVTGRLLNDREFNLNARSMRGNVGYQILTPLERADGGGIVMVNRGWVPPEKRGEESRREASFADTVTIEGVARVPRNAKASSFQPDNEAEKNSWFWIDLPHMARLLGVERIHPVVVEAGEAENPGGFPKGGQTRVSIPNDHLSYAITWYSLALALLVIYVLFHLRREKA